MGRTLLKWNFEDPIARGFGSLDPMTAGFIEFDAVESEDPEHDVQMTEYPVESGASLVDHVRVLPTRLRLTCHVSNNPARQNLTHMDGLTPSRGVDIRVRMPIVAGYSALSANVPGSTAGLSLPIPSSIAGVPLSREVTVRAQVRVWSGEIRRVNNVYEELLLAQRTARSFTVMTDMRHYDHMLLKSVRLSRTAENAAAPRFDLEFQQVESATLSERDVSDLLPKKPSEPRSKPPKDKGKQHAEEPDPAVEQSALDAIVEGVTKAVVGKGSF